MVTDLYREWLDDTPSQIVALVEQLEATRNAEMHVRPSDLVYELSRDLSKLITFAGPPLYRRNHGKVAGALTRADLLPGGRDEVMFLTLGTSPAALRLLCQSLIQMQSADEALQPLQLSDVHNFIAYAMFRTFVRGTHRSEFLKLANATEVPEIVRLELLKDFWDKTRAEPSAENSIGRAWAVNEMVSLLNEHGASIGEALRSGRPITQRNSADLLHPNLLKPFLKRAAAASLVEDLLTSEDLNAAIYDPVQLAPSHKPSEYWEFVGLATVSLFAAQLTKSPFAPVRGMQHGDDAIDFYETMLYLSNGSDEDKGRHAYARNWALGRLPDLLMNVGSVFRDASDAVALPVASAMKLLENNPAAILAVNNDRDAAFEYQELLFELFVRNSRELSQLRKSATLDPQSAVLFAHNFVERGAYLTALRAELHSMQRAREFIRLDGAQASKFMIIGQKLDHTQEEFRALFMEYGAEIVTALANSDTLVSTKLKSETAQLTLSCTHRNERAPELSATLQELAAGAEQNLNGGLSQ